jgi:thiosulfate reductase cytochrome b subunit
MTGTRAKRRRLWLLAGALIVAVAGIVFARLILASEGGARFIARYPGTVSQNSATPVGIPVWLAWQHALNAFFLVMIVRTGWLVRTVRKPAAHWTRNNRGFIRTKGSPKRISLDLWLHLSLDALWVLNGLVFIVLLFTTGQWRKVVPTSWDVLPNALSSGVQYAAFAWPTENGWVTYNALQLLTYFAVIFVLTPLAIISGLRLSGAWPQADTAINRVYPIELARKLHFPVMVAFVVFVVVHVALVLSTGALRNLEHMFAARDDGGWAGVVLFGVWLIVVVAAFLLARPIFLRPIASLTGKISR